MNEQTLTASETTLSRRQRGLFGVLAGTLLAGTVVVAPVATGVVQAEAWVVTVGGQELSVGNDIPSTGTPGFDANTASPVSPGGLTTNPGNDSTTQNSVMRSGDVTTYFYSVAANENDGDASRLNGVTFEQVFTPNSPLTVNDITVVPPTVGNCPVSRSVQVNVPVGSITVRCTFNLDDGAQRSIPIQIQAEGTAPNGTSFTSTQRVFATEGDGGLIDVPYDLSNDGRREEIFITNRPEWQLRKKGFFNADLTNVDPDGAGPELTQRGYHTYFTFEVFSMRKTGNEALQQPITFTDNTRITVGGGLTLATNEEFYITECRENPSSFTGTVFGADHEPGVHDIRSVPGSASNGTDCVFNRVDGPDANATVDNNDVYTFTVQNIDFAPSRYPTQTFGGGDLSNGPYIVASYRVRVFLPLSTIEDSNPTPQSGSVDLYNAISMEDADGDAPLGLSGSQNLAGNLEPGHCDNFESPLAGCDLNSVSPLVPSDNKIGPTNYVITPPGSSIDKNIYRVMNQGLNSQLQLLPSQSTAGSGDGLAEPGQTWISRFYSFNNTPYDQFNILCDVWDNTTQVLTDMNPGIDPDYPGVTYANMGAYNTTLHGQNVIEWGHVDLTGDNALSNDGDPDPDYLGATSRYLGVWTQMMIENKRCGDDTTPVADNGGVRWFTDPTQVPAAAGSGTRGIDNVNIVRIRPLGATANHGSGQYLLAGIGLKARNTFYGGPWDGESIPIGTVMPNASNHKIVTAAGATVIGYNGYTYNPNAHVDTAADRVTLTRGYMRVRKQTVSVLTNIDFDRDGNPDLSQGAATFDTTGNAQAGAPVVWELVPTLTSEIGGDAPVDLTMIDVLPPDAEYDAACTAAIAGGTPPDSIDFNTNNPLNPGAAPGYTLLTWNLGFTVPNANLGLFRICTNTDPLGATGQSVVNTTTLSSPGYAPSTDPHTVVLQQGSEVKVRKTVDAPLDLLNDNEVWTLVVRNFSEFASPNNPTIIDVFPFNGDASTPGGGLRTPASDFDGTNLITAAPVATTLTGVAETGVFTYTNENPATINQDPGTNTSVWCLPADFGVVLGCPANFAAVTAFKYQSNRALSTAGTGGGLDGLRITYTLDATANTPDNIYTNRFAMDSSSFPAAQYLLSNPVTVKTVGFDLGDYMWDDLDSDGKLDANEPPVPDGVTIELYNVGDVPGVDAPIATTTTVDGTWRFTGLDAGDFFVFVPASQFQTGGPLDQFVITPAAAEANANTDGNDTAGHNGTTGGGGVAVDGLTSQSITLSATTSPSLIGNEPTSDNTHGLTVDPLLDRFNNFTLDLAVKSPQVSIGDRVWLDVDRDGQQNANHTTEPGIVGVTVELLDAAGNSIDPDGPGGATQTTTTTGADGAYSFTGLYFSTDYQVKFTLPSGYQFTTQFTGGITGDSNANITTGIADVQTTATGNNSAITPDEPTIDAGMVEVDLSIAKVLNTATPIYPGDTVTFTLTPRNNGSTNALTGWTVTEVMPPRLTLVSMSGTGYDCTTLPTCVAANPLAAGATGNPITVTATVNAGPAVTAHNVTYVSPGPNEVVETNPLVVPTTSTDTSTTTTNNDAQADVPVTPLISVGDYVWFDLNRDGLQTGGELPVSGITVELLDASGNSIDPDGPGGATQTTTTTNGSGFYVFTDLLGGTSFQVKFTLPTGDHFTTVGTGAVGVGNDSNPVIATGITPVFTTPADGSNSATPGSVDLATIDAGVVRVDLALAKAVTSVGPYYEGSTVTFTLTPSNVGDTNAVAGWSVTDIMPEGLTATNIVGAAGGSSIYTCVLATLTCESSAALGIGAAGEQIIITATIDADFVGSAHNVAYVSPDDTEVTEVIPLITPDTDTNTSTTSTNNDAQADVTSTSLVSIGDYVWLDVNRNGIQDGTEPPVSGVTVELRDAGGNAIDPDGAGPETSTTTTTGTNGFYFFDDLLPNTNYVVVFTAPADHSFTEQGASGSTAANDSNVDTSGEAAVLTPPSGINETTPGDTDEPTIDAGLVNIDLALAKTLVTAPNYYPGKTIVYSLTPSNLGTTDALAGWSVTEILPAGMTLVSMAGTGYDCDPLPTCVAAGSLAAGGMGNVITVTATIDANITGTLHNVAYISPAPTEVTEEVPLGTTPTTSTVPADTTTNNDAAADLTSNIYDLALAKTVEVTGSGEETVLDYEIFIGNQGTVGSGDYTVVDIVPPGLAPTDISDGGSYDSGAGTITWELTGLAVDASTSVTWSAEVVDFTLRPYRNFAEISADGGAAWGGDNDSTPDADNTNDGSYGPIFDSAIDNESLDQAGTGDDSEDDADIADANIDVVYDLALAKAPSETTINPDGTVTFTITIENQGDVNSGDYTVTDTLPAGTQATAASDGGTITATTVTWALTDLAPGDAQQVSVTVAITDLTQRPFRNVAEISADGADVYDAVDDTYPGADVEDDDSTPDTTTGNDNGDVDGDGYGTFENPTNDIDDIADVDSTPNGEDDADVAFFDAPVLYDLALIKTGPAAISGAGTADFTITIKNQGNVPSGDFTVVDEIPAGLIATAASNGGVIADPLVTWNLSGLAAGATMTVTVTVKVMDFSTRPWVNVAEITSDGADDYDTEGYENPSDGDVEDDDSVPDSDLENDTVVDQDTLPTDQYNDPTVDEDDQDIAPIDVAIDYDIALVKSLPAGQSFKAGQPIVFNITVKNQGNVDSGPITVQDVVPAGLGVVTASDGGLGVGQVVTWEIANLTPGQIKTLTITVTVVNATLASYVNFAEIVADGADVYDLDGDDVEDTDSTPDSDITNDPLVDTDDVNIDQIPGDEDDHDRSLLDPAKVKSDNPKGGTIPGTGSNSEPLLFGAAGLFGAGALALLVARRRRKAAPAA